MIPKIIHYCWPNEAPIPDDLQKYMDTWHKVLPDYEIMKWDFNRFDKSSSVWVSQAFDNKKYAFVADYIRLYALYNYGGWYFDTDVEVLKSVDPFLPLKTAICWASGENNGLEIAAFGVERGLKWVKDCLEYYDDRKFVLSDGNLDVFPLPLIVEKQLKMKKYHLPTVHSVEEAKTKEKDENTIPVLTSDFFSPKNYNTLEISCTSNTCMIHHFSATWLSEFDRKCHRMFAKRKKQPLLFYSWYWLVYIPKYEWKKFLSKISISS